MPAKTLNIANQKFGRLLVLNRIGSNKYGSSTWNCLCDCGKNIIVIGRSLISKNTSSCGCLKEEQQHKLGFGQAAKNKLYSTYKKSASKRGRDFNLTFDEFVNITSKNCHYCNEIPLQTTHGRYNLYGHYIYNGIDRIDNKIGYLSENCVPCCKTCNYLKGILEYKEFLIAIEKIYEFKIS